MADMVTVKIDHVVSWRKTTVHTIDLDEVRAEFDLSEDQEITAIHLETYIESDKESGEPILWLPQHEYAEGYAFEDVDVWSVLFADRETPRPGPQPLWDSSRGGREIKVAEPDQRHV